MGDIKQTEGDIAHSLIPKHDARQKNDAADGMDQEVAIADLEGLWPATKPDKEHRTEGHHLPEKEQAQIIAAVDGAQGSGGIEPGRHVFAGPVDL